jgi:hypothetical protein
MMRRKTVPKLIDSAVDATALEKMEERAADIEEWLRDNHADDLKKARHLDAGTSERAYWHHGYLAALKDALRLLHHATDERTADSAKVN